MYGKTSEHSEQGYIFAPGELRSARPCEAHRAPLAERRRDRGKMALLGPSLGLALSGKLRLCKFVPDEFVATFAERTISPGAKLDAL
jgi:hypothetical protein